MQGDRSSTLTHFDRDRSLNVRALQQLLHLFILIAAGNLGNTIDFQSCTTGDLAQHFGGNLQAAAFEIHIL